MSVAGWGRRPADGLFVWRPDEPQAAEVDAAFRNPRAAQVLIGSAIPLTEAFKRGVRWMDTVTEPTLLKPEFKGKGIPPEGDGGLIFPHYSLSGERTLQYRPDTPYSVTFADGTVSKPRKYDWGRSGASGISIGFNAARRIADGTARRLAIPEGTRQAIAADIWAPGDVAAVGIQGIWNGQKGRVMLPDLRELAPQFDEIILIPDGDVASNAHVWKGADLLHTLLSATAPKAAIRVVALPADGKEGLDDILGRVNPSERTQYLAALLDQAGTLPAPPEGVKPVTPPAERTIWQRFDAAVDAADAVIALYGGDLTDEGLETAEGVLTVGRLRDGAGFVKAESREAARLLGVSIGKVVTASSILIGAVGKKGAYRVLDTHKDALSDVVAWVEEHADNLDAGIQGLATAADRRREKASARRKNADLIAAFNAMFTVPRVGGDPRKHRNASQVIGYRARALDADRYDIMRDLIAEELARRAKQ